MRQCVSVDVTNCRYGFGYSGYCHCSWCVEIGILPSRLIVRGCDLPLEIGRERGGGGWVVLGVGGRRSGALEQVSASAAIIVAGRRYVVAGRRFGGWMRRRTPR